jgi:hypothetical protein
MGSLDLGEMSLSHPVILHFIIVLSYRLVDRAIAYTPVQG